MTGLRDARWTGTGRPRPRKRVPESKGGVGSPPQEPRWNADRRAHPLVRAAPVRRGGWTTRLSAFRLLFLPEASLEIAVFRRSVGETALRPAPDFLLGFVLGVVAGKTRARRRREKDFAGRHCEPTGPARSGRPMTGSAKQSSAAARTGLLRRFAPRNDEGFPPVALFSLIPAQAGIQSGRMKAPVIFSYI
jgi:hypothetical protein